MTFSRYTADLLKGGLGRIPQQARVVHAHGFPLHELPN